MPIQSSRHVLITGAAGALGQAVVAQFAAEGAQLVLIDRDVAALQAAFPQWGEAQGHSLLSADVTSVEAMHQVAASIARRHPRIDVLVHVAGGFEMGDPTHALGREAWDRMMNLNAWSFVAVTRPFVPAMVAAGAGKIVAVTARGAERGSANMAAYAASKSALQRLVESLSSEVRAAGVNVNSIAPGTLDTPANRGAMPDADSSTWVSTASAAQAVAFLASAGADPVHGRHLILDALS